MLHRKWMQWMVIVCLVAVPLAIVSVAGNGCASKNKWSNMFGTETTEDTGFRWGDRGQSAPKATGVDPRARDIERRLGFR